MNAKTTIRKIVFIAIWLCIGGGMFTLLLAAISQKKKGQCKEYLIVLKGNKNNFFIAKNDIEDQLIKTTKGSVKGRPVSSINLHELEQVLEQNPWIDAAELYFDNRDILHVNVSEKEPVARIFTRDGRSFYLDNGGRTMPLSDKRSARVPVFTGFPDKKTMSSKDSLLLNQIKVTANFILHDPFWNSQVTQVDITTDRKMEMVPLVGNHLVKLGYGDNLAQKFYRLKVFYRQVLSKTGLDKYKWIDVQYKGQVIASDFSGETNQDSDRLRKNVEKLLHESKEEYKAEIKKPSQPDVTKTQEMDLTPGPVKKSLDNNMDPGIESPDSLLKYSRPEVSEKKEDLPDSMSIDKPMLKEEKRVPKAVMPKRTVKDE